MYVFIVNPVAGDGRAKRIHRKIQKLDELRDMETRHYITRYRGHATEIVKDIEREAAEGEIVQAIIVIGGDGTIHEVVNGLIDRKVPIVYIPGGSGNDFARGAAIEKDYKRAMDIVLNESVEEPFWLGAFETDEEKQRRFVNCIGFGFDAVVAKSAKSVPFRRVLNKLGLGTFIYLFALIRELITYKPFDITLEMDGVKREFKDLFLVTINNHAYFGGGMKINPLAKNNGEHLSVLVVDSISKWKVLALFSMVFTGRHLQFKEVHTFEAKEIGIYGNTLLPYQVDGECGETGSAIMSNDPKPMSIKGSLEIAEA